MNKIDWTTYKFRPSALGKLMTNGRKKGELGETTKSYLKAIFIAEAYGREKDISNKFTEKGILTEEDSLTLVTNSGNYGKLLIKNKERIGNEFIQGTPDVILKDKVLDIKSSWDIWTFGNADGENKDYYWQLQGYMWITGTKLADLVYCLNNSPEHLIVSEKKKQMYFLGLDGLEDGEAFIEMEKEVEKNMIFDDIPAEEKIKVFNFEYHEEEIEQLKERIIECRKYLETIKL